MIHLDEPRLELVVNKHIETEHLEAVEAMVAVVNVITCAAAAAAVPTAHATRR